MLRLVLKFSPFDISKNFCFTACSMLLKCCLILLTILWHFHKYTEYTCFFLSLNKTIILLCLIKRLTNTFTFKKKLVKALRKQNCGFVKYVFVLFYADNMLSLTLEENLTCEFGIASCKEYHIEIRRLLSDHFV